MAEQEYTPSVHEAAMIAKVDAAQAGYNPPVAAPPVIVAPAIIPTRPENIPVKFWDASKGVANVDAMAKSYAELERTRTSPVAAAVVPPVIPDAPGVANAAAPEAAPVTAAAAAKAAVDYVALTAEFTANGSLTEARYAELEADGKPRAMVDAFIAGQLASAKVAEFEQQAATNEAYALTGGKEAFEGMLRWAGVNLSQDDQAAFDTAVTGNAAARKQAVTALKAQYTAARGSDPKLVSGAVATSNAQTFQSRAEVTAAMRDPRYKSDPAYRSSVMQRMDSMVF